MEGILKELGEWAAANPNAVPPHLREAVRRLPTEVTQAGQSSGK